MPCRHHKEYLAFFRIYFSARHPPQNGGDAGRHPPLFMMPPRHPPPKKKAARTAAYVVFLLCVCPLSIFFFEVLNGPVIFSSFHF